MRVERERIRLLARLEELMAQQDLVFYPPRATPPSGITDLNQVPGKHQRFIVGRVRSLWRARHISSVVFGINEDRFGVC
jgi:hypothetical protein